MVKELLKKAREKFTDPKLVLADTIIRILDEKDMLKLQYRHIKNRDIEDLALIFTELYNFPMEEMIEDNTGIQNDIIGETNREEIVTESVVIQKAKPRKSSKKV